MDSRCSGSERSGFRVESARLSPRGTPGKPRDEARQGALREFWLENRRVQNGK